MVNYHIHAVGIDTILEAPGYKRFKIRPVPGGGLTYAGAELDTVRGCIACRWEFSEEQFVLKVSVPANTSAEIYLPAFVKQVLDSDELEFEKTEDGFIACTDAGSYRIVCGI